jgi:hypothetical protein
MSTHDLHNSPCLEHLTFVYTAIEAWLHREVDLTGQDRDDVLCTMLGDLLLHLDRLADHDVDSNVVTFHAEERILRVLDWLQIAPNDVHALFHLAYAYALHADDIDTVTRVARIQQQNARTGTDLGTTEPLAASMFTLERH